VVYLPTRGVVRRGEEVSMTENPHEAWDPRSPAVLTAEDEDAVRAVYPGSGFAQLPLWFR
jgi:hypothetical protein